MQPRHRVAPPDQRGARLKRRRSPIEHGFDRLFQTNLVRWHPGYTAGEAHENEGSADRAGLVKAKEAILGGVGTDQARHQRADFRQQTIEVL